MNVNSSCNDTSSHTSEENSHGSHKELAIFPKIQFWILLIPTILAILCSIFVLAVILGNTEHRRSLHYRVIIIQLVGGLLYLLTHIPIYLNYLVLDRVWPETPAMCQFWWFVGDGYSDTMTILMAWASFERHILIFHNSSVATRRRRFYIHYLPVILIIMYCPVYYIIVNGFPPCENHYDYDEESCAFSCLHQNPVLVMYDIIVNHITATLLVAIFSSSLIIRITCQNTIQAHVRSRWKRHRKLIIILLIISIVYLIFNLPLMIVTIAQMCGLSEDVVEEIEPYVEFLNYYVLISYPFICFITIFRKQLIRRKQNIIVPVGMSITQQSITQRQNKKPHSNKQRPKKKIHRFDIHEQ